MIKLFKIILLLLSSFTCHAQTLMDNREIIFLKSAADTLFVSGNFTNNSSGTVNVKGLLRVKGNTTLLSGSEVIIDTTGIVQMGGALSNNGIFNASAGTVEMIGNASQILPVGSFTNNAVSNLIISNTHASGVVMTGAVDIYRSLTYSAGGTSLTTGDSLTFKSSAAQTAWLGNMTGHIITGKAIVERFISARRAWRLLSVPTGMLQTVKHAWQENASVSAENPKPGYGTQISDNTSSWAANGFDFLSPGGPSLKKYISATNSFTGIVSTNDALSNSQAYFAFIRGDRTVTGVGAPTRTVLRTYGTLYTGDRPAISVAADKFETIGNPYASRVDVRNITKTGLRDFFYVWDPVLGGGSGLGAYQLLSNDEAGNYVITPGSGSYGNAGSICNDIESGHAFLVQAGATGGSLTFKEEAKNTGSILTSVAATGPQASLRLNLLGVNGDGSSYTNDGILVNFDETNASAVNEFDAVKMINTKENLAIKRSGNLLSLERRGTLTANDTVFLSSTNLKTQNYRFNFDAQYFGGVALLGYLDDAYLNTSSPVNLSGQTAVNFSVSSNPASYASDRFRLVFKLAGVLPFRFTDLSANRAGEDVVINWKTSDEETIVSYTPESSADGFVFVPMNPVQANHTTGTYSQKHLNPSSAPVIYRIRSKDLTGRVAYSKIVIVAGKKGSENISVFPNPVSDGVLHIIMKDLQYGSFELTLVNVKGQTVYTSIIDLAGQTANYSLKLNGSVTRGNYIITFTHKGEFIRSQRITVL